MQCSRLSKVLTFGVTCLFACLAMSAVPVGTAFTYSGRLIDKATGKPANGSYEMRFSLYEADTEGVALAGPVDVGPVAVSNGIFGVEVDFGAGVFGKDAARWMEVGVRPAGGKGEFEVFPKRQRLTSVPYALQAESARNAAEAGSVNIKGGVLRVAGAGLQTSTPVFIHKADKSNIQGNNTTLDNPLTNDDPGAIVIVTHNWSADTAKDRYERAPFGVFYTGTRWAIFHEDQSAMEDGRAFNVIIVKP